MRIDISFQPCALLGFNDRIMFRIFSSENSEFSERRSRGGNVLWDCTASINSCALLYKIFIQDFGLCGTVLYKFVIFSEKGDYWYFSFVQYIVDQWPIGFVSNISSR